MRALLLLIAAGCGRLEFGVLADGGVDDDAPPDVSPCGQAVCPDPTFGVDGLRTIDVLGTDNSAFGSRATAIQPDGKLVVVGTAGPPANTDLLIVRLERNGANDLGFGSAGITVVDTGALDEELNAVALTAGGKIVFAGETPTRAVVGMLDSNGLLLASFDGDGYASIDVGGAGNPALNGVEVDASERIVVGGQSYYNSQFDLISMRLLGNGALDPTFDSDGLVTLDLGGRDEFGTLATHGPGGNIYLVGQSYSAVTASDGALVRMRSDGSLDPSFGTGGSVRHDLGGTNKFYVLAVDANQRLVVGGDTDGATDTDFVVGRFLPTGAVDTSFGTNGFTTIDRGDDRLRALAIAPDGRIVAGGRTVTPNEHSVLLVLSKDGVVESETELVPGVGANGIDHLVFDASGRLVVTGDLIPTNSTQNDIYVMRLALP